MIVAILLSYFVFTQFYLGGLDGYGDSSSGKFIRLLFKTEIGLLVIIFWIESCVIMIISSLIACIDLFNILKPRKRYVAE